MHIRTISASALLNFENCPKQYWAENNKRAPKSGDTMVADLGSVVHDALENYVRFCFIDKTKDEDWALLAGLFRIAWTRIMNSTDYSVPEYKEGLMLLERWFERADFRNINVLSVEEKYPMEFNTSQGVVPLNYIWDRCEEYTNRAGELCVRIVDYKTIRSPFGPEDLKNKLQARVYAMTAMFKFKDKQYAEYAVMFDLLRFDEVEVKFTREECIETWKRIKEIAERIIAMPDDDPENPIPEVLGAGCSFCIRKTTCESVRRNAEVGGVMSMLGNREELAKAYDQLKAAEKASKYGAKEIESMLLADAMSANEIEYDTDSYSVKFGSRNTRYYDAAEVREIVGDNIAAGLGNVSVKAVDDLLKGDVLDMVQKSRLRSAVKNRVSDPTPTVKKKQ